MKRRWFSMIAAVLLTTAPGFAGQPGTDSSNPPAFENGAIADGVYSNECFGFALPIPAGWEVDVTAGGKARHRSDGSLVLLFLRQQGKLPGRILLSARNATDHTGNAQDFVSDTVRSQINSPTEKRELVRYTFAVDYGGRHFFRSDYKTFLPGNVALYLGFVYTEFRGYFIGEILAAASPEGLDQAANSLQQIAFREDEPKSKCVMSGDTGLNISGVLGGGLSSNPPQTDTAQAQRVRVPQAVSNGLLVTKVQPRYPEDAKRARIQGQVVLGALIDKNGGVEELTLVSGHPMLAPAAIEAVKQWKYKPFLLNGQPVKVETQILVDFQLAGQ